MALLLIKGNTIQDKEILAILMSMTKEPPAVWDLHNTTYGWEKGTKKTGPGVVEDFYLDASMYLEFQNYLGKTKNQFNQFIMKIAPCYELLRSLVRAEIKNINIQEINQKLRDEGFQTKLTNDDLQAFQKLLALPLWMEKIAGAYKHALWLETEGERQIPLLREIQGPDVVPSIDLMTVDIEEKLHRIAERLADERLDQEMKELGPQGWKQLWRLDKIVAKWWKRNALEAYRQKYIIEIKERLKQDPKYRTELMQLNREEVKPGYRAKWSGATPAEGTRVSLNDELDAIAERFGISWSTRDTTSYLTRNEQIIDIANEDIQNALRNLCRNYLNGTYGPPNTPAADAEFKRQVHLHIIPQIKQIGLQDPATGKTISNDEIIAFLEEKGVLGTVPLDQRAGLLDKLKAHHAGLIALDLDNLKINLKLGIAKNVDVKTKTKDLSWFDRATRKMVEHMQQNKVLGRLFSPTTIGIMGFGLANITAQILTGKYMRYGALATIGLLAPTMAPAVAGIATGCLVGGFFGFMRKNKETLYHKAQKERRQALQYRPDDDNKGLRPHQRSESRFERRLEQGDRLYHKESARTLQENIRTAQNFNDLRNALARAIELNRISEMGETDTGEDRVDLISFDGEGSIESQRLQLVRSIAEGKIRFATIEPGRDHITELEDQCAQERAAIIAEMHRTERNFRRLKRWENWKAAGIGAIIGGSISALLGYFIHHTQTTSHIEHLTPQGRVDEATLRAALEKTLPPEEMSYITFDPSTHQLTPETVSFLKTRGIDIQTFVVPTTASDAVGHLFGGKTMSKVDFLQEIRTHGLDPQQITFDSSGHLTPASIQYLKDNGITVQEVITSMGTTSAQKLSQAGFQLIDHIHFNDNQPHPLNQHILDELRLWWNGQPEIGSDGCYHFSIKEMFNSAVGHSHLPPDIQMPTDPSQLKVGLQVNVGDHHFWKFFTPDQSGNIVIPGEYFQPPVDYVPRGGSILPGLKADALAVGFDDPHGTYQVLASVKGNGGYIPHEEIGFTGDMVHPYTTVYEATRKVTDTTVDHLVPPPIYGDKMNHLEYGKKDSISPPREESSDKSGTEDLPPPLSPSSTAEDSISETNPNIDHSAIESSGS